MRIFPLLYAVLLSAMVVASWGSEGEGAPHWAFQPVREPQPGDSIDRFIERELAQIALTPLGKATPEALLRRLHFNLTGLPPSLEEQDQFQRECASDGIDRAVEKRLDELLA